MRGSAPQGIRWEIYNPKTYIQNYWTQHLKLSFKLLNMPISTIHHMVGGILLLIYLLALITAFLKEDISRKVRMVGDIVLFFQYLIGVIMLIVGLSNVHLHYIFALLPVILIPFSKKLGYRITTLLFFIIILLAYLSGLKRGL